MKIVGIVLPKRGPERTANHDVRSTHFCACCGYELTDNVGYAHCGRALLAAHEGAT
jgi:hypothetical protein